MYVHLYLCQHYIYILITTIVKLNHVKLTVLDHFGAIKSGSLKWLSSIPILNLYNLNLYFLLFHTQKNHKHSFNSESGTIAPPPTPTRSLAALRWRGSKASGTRGSRRPPGQLSSSPGLRVSWSPPLSLLTKGRP